MQMISSLGLGLKKTESETYEELNEENVEVKPKLNNLKKIDKKKSSKIKYVEKK